LKLKVGHLRIAVEQVDDRPLQEWRGVFDPEKLRILILRSLCPAEKLEVLLHEILHACAWANGWHGRELTEEDAVTWASRGLTQVLIDNEAELLGLIGASLRQNRID
jgi:hypothetical protein